MSATKRPRLTTTSYALLGLLAIRPWTAYELTQQMRRSLHYLWPKSESLLYTEPKKLVDAGLAQVSEQRRGDRTRAQYSINANGRRALEAWLDTEPAAPAFELEAMLRVIFADQGTPQQLAGSLRSLAAWAEDELRRARPQIEDYLDTGGPFPQRLHLIALVVGFYGQLFDFIRRFSLEAAAIAQTWDATTAVPVDTTLRHMLERTLRFSDSVPTPRADTVGEDRQLTRQEASDTVGAAGWRFVLGTLRTAVAVDTLAQATEVAAAAVAAAGPHADEHLRIDVRRDRVLLNLQSHATGSVTARDADLALRISRGLHERGLRTDPDGTGGGPRSVQVLEIAIDALDVAAVRPFWKAALGYVDEPGASGPEDALVDPLGQGPAVWFQQMDAPRPQRNRIHLDIAVPHDEAGRRIDAVLAAGGRLLSDASAPSFWVLADPEGNEACISTWQGRDN